jgi:hypothetical protein
MSVPVMAPTAAWVTPVQVAECCSVEVGTNTSLFDTVSVEASQILYELSGQRFSGATEVTDARPCSDSCGCWGDLLTPMSPGAPQISGWGAWGGLGWGWGWEGCGEVCGCGVLSRVNLSGYPVVEITEVKIDGDIVDPAGYRLDDWEYLTRLADENGNAQFWPSCQRLDVGPDDPESFAVSYIYGYDPPLPGVHAAQQLACELYKACTTGICLLPAGTTKIDRQGISIERAPFLAWGKVNNQWATGLALVDIFLAAYNPGGLIRPTTVWSPDVQQDAKILG